MSVWTPVAGHEGVEVSETGVFRRALRPGKWVLLSEEEAVRMRAALPEPRPRRSNGSTR